MAVYNTDEASHIALSRYFGKNFDRDFRWAQLASNFKILKNMAVNYEFNYLKYSPDPTNSSAYINILGLDYYFTKDIWLRVITQNNTNIDKYYFYCLFGWRFKPPFGALYFIVNTDNFRDISANKKVYSEVAFLKLTYPITFGGR